MKYLKTFEENDIDVISFIEHGYYDAVKNYLELGGDVNHSNMNDETLIFIAFRYDELDIVDLLLEYNPDLTKKSYVYSETVLNDMLSNKKACEHGGYIKKILDKEISILNNKNANGYAPLLTAAIFNYGDSLFELLEYNPNWNDYILEKNNKKITFIEVLEFEENNKHFEGNSTLQKVKELYPEKYKEYLKNKQLRKFKI